MVPPSAAARDRRGAGAATPARSIDSLDPSLASLAVPSVPHPSSPVRQSDLDDPIRRENTHCPKSSCRAAGYSPPPGPADRDLARRNPICLPSAFGCAECLAAGRHSASGSFQPPPRTTRFVPDAGPVGSVTAPPG